MVVSFTFVCIDSIAACEVIHIVYDKTKNIKLTYEAKNTPNKNKNTSNEMVEEMG